MTMSRRYALAAAWIIKSGNFCYQQDSSFSCLVQSYCHFQFHDIIFLIFFSQLVHWLVVLVVHSSSLLYCNSFFSRLDSVRLQGKERACLKQGVYSGAVARLGFCETPTKSAAVDQLPNAPNNDTPSPLPTSHWLSMRIFACYRPCHATKG